MTDEHRFELEDDPDPAVISSQQHVSATRRRRRWPLVLLSLVLVGLLLLGAGGVWAMRQVDPPGPPGDEVTVVVPAGSSSRRIGAILDDRGVIRSARVWNLYVRLNGEGPWQAGQYTFRRNSDLGAVVRVLDRGPFQDIRRLTIPEGFTLTQIAQRVARLPGRSAERFLTLARGGTVRSRFQPEGSTNLEGLLFPDTYEIDPKKDDEAAILRRMVDAFDQEMTAAGIDQAPTTVGLSPYEVVIVASMIEREARIADERGKVARVVYNRLQQRIRLGIDATIRYELNKPSGPLRRSELQRDTPYNTRTRAGLPPTPIANPGRASVDAALHPTPGPWIYYVLADRDGRHAFVTTDAEFQRAKAEARTKGLL